MFRSMSHAVQLDGFLHRVQRNRDQAALVGDAREEMFTAMWLPNSASASGWRRRRCCGRELVTEFTRSHHLSGRPKLATDCEWCRGWNPHRC